MNRVSFLFFFLLAAACPLGVRGQVHKTAPQDSVCNEINLPSAPKPSLVDRLDSFAMKKNIVSRLLRSVMVFDNKKIQPKDTTKISQQQYDNYRCKIIRNINIIVLGPFGYSVTEAYGHRISELQRLGDQVHYSSRQWIIKDKLLFKPGDAVESVNISESERLIRQSPYIVDARINLYEVPESPDSVDVQVVAQDVFNLSAGASGSAVPTADLNVTDINFLGLGQKFYNEIWYNPQYAQHYKYSGSYAVPQIANTYISAETHYTSINYDRDFGFSVSRPFFSSTTHWAGGLDMEFNHSAYSITLPDSITYTGLHNFSTKDFWLGYAFNISEENKYYLKNPKMVISGRVYNITYSKQNQFPDDFNHFYQNDLLYLAGIGLTQRDYYKDHYIFAFGKTEDIPLGYLLTLNTGPDFEQFSYRWYYGAKASYGWNNSLLGYLYLSAEAGCFRNGNTLEEGVLNTELFYFTRLISAGDWHLRLYLVNMFTHGYNRMPGEAININGNNGLPQFSSPYLNGTQRWTNDCEADFFSPLKPLGFETVLVLYYDQAMIGTGGVNLLHTRVYQGYGLGIRFKNEHFIFNTLEISLHYFPGANTDGGNAYKFYSRGSSGYQFQDFQFSEPYIASFK